MTKYWFIFVASVVVMLTFLLQFADRHDRWVKNFRAQAVDAFAKCEAAGGRPVLPLIRDKGSDVTLCVGADGRIMYALPAEIIKEK